MSYNKILLLGNVGKDPEVREFDGGKVVSFTLATTERAYTKQNGTQVPEHTDWHNCTCFGKTAESATAVTRTKAARPSGSLKSLLTGWTISLQRQTISKEAIRSNHNRKAMAVTRCRTSLHLPLQ